MGAAPAAVAVVTRPSHRRARGGEQRDVACAHGVDSASAGWLGSAALSYSGSEVLGSTCRWYIRAHDVDMAQHSTGQHRTARPAPDGTGRHRVGWYDMRHTLAHAGWLATAGGTLKWC